jgi:predicted transcriptional regulator
MSVFLSAFLSNNFDSSTRPVRPQNQTFMALSKEDSAKELFFSGFSQKKIADILETTEQTISRWVKKYTWDQERAKLSSSKESIELRIFKLIEYQLWVLEQKAEEAMSTGTPTAIDKGEIDALSKLFASVKAKEITFAQKVKLISDFTEFINTEDPEIAKRIIKLSEQFIYKLKDDYNKA